MYRHSLSLFALIAMVSAMSGTASAAEEESGVLPLPALSAGSAQINARTDDTASSTARAAEVVDCFYEWNKNEPACADDSNNKKDARP